MPNPEEQEPIEPQDEAAVKAMLNPDGSMTRPMAVAYVQHSLAEWASAVAVEFRATAADESKPEIDRKDAALCAEVAEATAKDLRLANTMILAQQQRVQAASVVRIPGTRLPGGAR